MTFEQWKATRREVELCDIDESEFHELTGNMMDTPEFSFGDYDAESLIVYDDGAWMEKHVAQREGVAAYMVTISNFSGSFPDLGEAEKFIWENHSSDNYPATFTPSDAIAYAEKHLNPDWQAVANNRASGFHEATSLADRANEIGGAGAIGKAWAEFIESMESDNA